MRRVLMVIGVMALTLVLALPVQAASDRNFVAPMDGGQENPPVITQATGVTKFQFSKDGTTLGFKLIVANIDNVFAAHIHCGAAEVNGPVGVTLFTSEPTGRVNGILAQGTISGPDAGNACGWEDLADVNAAMQSGDTYVNVHTNPDAPTGEIRGQVK